MEQAISQPSMLKIEFEELYQRHLCRHSQFLLNLLHFFVVVVVYYCLMGLTGSLIQWLAIPSPVFVLALLAAPYFIILALNVPVRCLLASGLVFGMILAAVSAFPALPWYLYLVIAVAAHRFQVWHHRFFKFEKDMTEFNHKYKKGLHLFLLLSLYELPLLLEYLLFRKSDWMK